MIQILKSPKIGKDIRLNYGLKVKFPWKLIIGNYCWIGEDTWIDNISFVTLKDNICISQGVYICSGNHNYKKTSFDLIVKPIIIDSDVWIGAKSIIGPGYKINSRVNWVFGKLAIIKSQNFKHAVNSNISYEKARKLAFAPHINIGVFSLEKNSNAWKSWQENLKETLKAGEIFGSEQLAMNISVYVDNLQATT